jgi:hypothetical protein
MAWEAARADYAWRWALRPVVAASIHHKRVLGRFARWLRDDRGLRPNTIRLRLWSMRSFLESSVRNRHVRDAMRRLLPRELERFFVAYRALREG